MDFSVQMGAKCRKKCCLSIQTALQCKHAIFQQKIRDETIPLQYKNTVKPSRYYLFKDLWVETGLSI